MGIYLTHEVALALVFVFDLKFCLKTGNQVSATLRDIVNTQNAQITFMRSYLEGQNATLEGEACENDEEDSDHDVPSYAIVIMAGLGVLCLALCATLVSKGKTAKNGSHVADKTLA